jgi:mannose-6-phosphate isomerase-like protein (cupin superfamily)
MFKPNNMVSKISLSEQKAKLPLPATDKWPNGVWDINAFMHGSMSLVLFTPKIHDYQTPHEQDELYVVYKGSGKLVTTEGSIDFNEGDVLFVGAGDEHRFDEFTNDLILWAIFWGPKGGEPLSLGQNNS